MEIQLRYSIKEKNGNEDGECKARLDDSGLTIGSASSPILLSFRDIGGIDADDYKVVLSLVSGGTVVISQLGYAYEDFARELSRMWNSMMLRDLLMDEQKESLRVSCDFSHSPPGSKPAQGQCELRFFGTGLVFIPQKGAFIRIPLSEIADIQQNGLSLILKSEYDGDFTFAKMGRDADRIHLALTASMDALSSSTQKMLQEAFPEAGYAALRKISSLMKDGKAARKAEIDEAAPGMWEALETKMDAAGLRDYFDSLSSISRKERMCIGVKKGLMGPESEYLWFLLPIYSVDPEKDGNAIAMEAASESGSGKATYFFRLMGRSDYRKTVSLGELDSAFDSFLRRINRCMIKVNFRREPVYLSEKRLKEPKYARYRFAIARIPELRELRSQFIGRVIHGSQEQWKKDVAELLAFNASAKTDEDKWKNDMDATEGEDSGEADAPGDT